MESIFTIIRQDLEIAKKAIEKDDINPVQFAGNRIMMNLLAKDRAELMLLGNMVRDLSAELQFIKNNRRDSFTDAKKEAIAFLKDLEAYVTSGNIDPKIYWERYGEMEANLRIHNLSEIEESVYNEQSEFARDFSIKILDIFYSRKNDISTSKNPVGMMSFELSRNFNEHGGKEALVIYLVFRAFENYYAHLLNEKQLPHNKKWVQRVGTKLAGYIENVYELKSNMSNIDELYKKSATIINNLGIDEKLLYLSLSLYSKNVGEELELPENTKQKIGETIMQSLRDTRKNKGEVKDI